MAVDMAYIPPCPDRSRVRKNKTEVLRPNVEKARDMTRNRTVHRCHRFLRRTKDYPHMHVPLRAQDAGRVETSKLNDRAGYMFIDRVR